MTRTRAYAEKITEFERKSGKYATLLCFCLVGVTTLLVLFLGMSVKTLFTVPAASGAVPSFTVREDNRQYRSFRLPPIQHQLLSQIKTERNPVIPVYVEEPMPEESPIKNIQPAPEKIKKTAPRRKNKEFVPKTQKLPVGKKETEPEVCAETVLTAGSGGLSGDQDDAQGVPTLQSAGGGTGEYSLIAAEIHRAVERHKHYPKRARRIGDEGTATLRFSLATTGKIVGCEVLRSSGSSLLDSATKELGVKLVGTVISSANGLGPVTISTPVRYSLR